MTARFARHSALRAALALGFVLPFLVAAEPPAAADVPALDAWVVAGEFGHFRIRFDRSAAPNHVAHFLGLAASGFYDGLSFHRIVPGLVVQTGAAGTRAGHPRDWVLEPPDYRIPAEPGPDAPVRGTVAMAWQGEEPGTAGTEWFVLLADRPVDGRSTAIGEVIQGMEVVDKVARVSTYASFRPLQPIPVQVRLGPVDTPDGELPPSLQESSPEGEGEQSGES